MIADVNGQCLTDWPRKPPSEELLSQIVETYSDDGLTLGRSPTGMQAALHTARAKVIVALLGRTKKSSLNRAHKENYYRQKRSDGKTDAVE